MRENPPKEPPRSAFRPGRFRCVIFDLDGTLIDSLPAIAAAVNEVRAAHGREPRSTAEVREAIGDGARVLVSRIFSDFVPEARLDAVHREFIAVYAEHSVAEAEPWRRGALDLLGELRDRGVPAAILSNKPLALTEAILERTATRSMFAAVRGPENSPSAKPDPRALTDLVAALGVRREDALFVGDSVVDFETGIAAEVATVGVRGGYRAEGPFSPDHWFEDPAALAAAWRESR